MCQMLLDKTFMIRTSGWLFISHGLKKKIEVIGWIESAERAEGWIQTHVRNSTLYICSRGSSYRPLDLPRSHTELL